MDDAKCLTELNEVLTLMNEEEYKKIPEDILRIIAEHKDKEYIWKYDKSKSLLDQNLDRKTIAMLSYINMNYLLDDEQRDILQQMHRFNEQKLENEKLKKYDIE